MDTNSRASALIDVDSIASGILWTTVMAVTTAIASNAAFKLPFTPVPITLQVFAVVLSGLLLGSKLGALSQIEYVAVGLLGAPVFAGGGSGIAHLLGPTGGYLIGFIAGAFLTGLLVEKLKSKSISIFFLASMLGVMAIYLFGTSWLAVWLGTSKHVPFLETLPKAWALGAAPFIIIDIVKSMLAASAAAGADKVRRR